MDTVSEQTAVEESQKSSLQVSFYIFRALAFVDRNRSTASLMGVVLLVVLGDILFDAVLFEPYKGIIAFFSGSFPEGFEGVDMGFSAEVWQALLGMILGTLILVISIASQSIPKLIDLYMKDLPSLIYVWFLIVSGMHAILINLYADIDLVRPASRVFNTHILLVLSAFFAFPYIFYILRYTKPSNVISRIYGNNLDQIHDLTTERAQALITVPNIREQYQVQMFEALNQLDDILEYVSFKELKADIIHQMSLTIHEYVRVKSHIGEEFFSVMPKVRTDISFKTMIGQYGDMEKSKTFYEQKLFRLLGNVYIRQIEDGSFDLASLVAAEMSEIGLTAIEVEDDNLVDVIIIRFNTLLRFAIKHAIKNNEARNLYNVAFHYGNFVNHLADHQRIDYLKRCFMYFRIYGIEIFKHGKNSPALYFIVDVIATEMKKLLEKVYNEKWDRDLQTHLLGEILQVDNPPDVNKEDLDQGVLINNGVRILQIGLALFYERNNDEEFVEKILKDVMDDVNVLGEINFSKVIEISCGRLKFAGPTFWEDTDRGNLNIYYTPDQNLVDGFKVKLYERARLKLIETVSKEFRLEENEAQLLWEMSRLMDVKDYKAITKKAEIFEQSIQKLGQLDYQKLDLLVKLREKLRFTSENPDLVVGNSRQVAPGVQLTASYRSPTDHHQNEEFSALVRFNSPNFIYFEPSDTKQLPAYNKERPLPITFRFTTSRHKRVYQFNSQLDPSKPQERNLYRVLHTEKVKIIAEG
ncbi:MAG: hypothetical protein P8O70_16580 [SAR324 cluster bacterium]|nr:hypothetical protein [SAR324 cluster bacterium]